MFANDSINSNKNSLINRNLFGINFIDGILDHHKICACSQLSKIEVRCIGICNHFLNYQLSGSIGHGNFSGKGFPKTDIYKITGGYRIKDDVAALFDLVDIHIEVYYITISSYKYVWSLIRGKGDPKQLGGPIRIAKISGQVAQFGFLAFISTIAYISIALGAVNLLPIPLLDGGTLAINIIDTIKPNGLNGRTVDFLYRIGIVIIGSLVIFTTFNDLKDLGLF